MLNQWEELKNDIKSSYESGTTMEEAEKLAAKFLYAQIEVAQALQTADLDSRMRKSGVKAVRAAIFYDEATKSDKKPSDKTLDALVDMNKIVIDEQRGFDETDVLADALRNYFSIFQNAHIHFRSVSRGRFE